MWLAAIFIASTSVGKFGEFGDFLAVQMRSVGGCSWRFSKLWISRGFGAVAVLVGEVLRLRGKIWWERSGNTMLWNFGDNFVGSEV